jgi:hypothetical protein
VLGEPPPTISLDEALLPRPDRVHLARVRCGHHPALLSYENRIRPDVDPTCRWCGDSPETVSHIFDGCIGLLAERAVIGIRSSRDLWDRPILAVEFLRSIGLI